MSGGLSIDFGTSTTAAMLVRPDGRPAPLLFDGSPLLPSAVFADADGDLLVGRDAWHSARVSPQRLEPNPKRRVDDGTVLLGDREVPVAELIAAVLRRVAAEANRVSGAPVGGVTLTYPIGWGKPRREVLCRAADAAGLPPPRLVAEPVAAADHFVRRAGGAVPLGGCVAVYDFGAGTFDATVVRRAATGLVPLASEGLPDVGGLDVDAAILDHLGRVCVARDADRWRELTEPATEADRRALRQLWDDIRTGKEMLSRAPATVIPVPALATDVLLSREEFDNLAAPILERTVAALRAAVDRAGVAPSDLGGVFLVGGSSRIPLAATLLHRALGKAPTAIEWPELVVAEGALAVPPPRPPAVPPVSVPARVVLPPVNGRRSLRRPATVLATAAVATGFAAALSTAPGRESFTAGVRAPLGPTAYGLLLAAVVVLTLGRFAKTRLLPGAGPLPAPGRMAALAGALAAGFAGTHLALAALVAMGGSGELTVAMVTGRARPLLLLAVLAGLATAGVGAWLLSGATPADPLRRATGPTTGPLAPLGAALAGALLGLAAQTHVYGTTVDDGVVGPGGAVLHVAWVLQTTGDTAALSGRLVAYSLGVAAVFVVAVLAAAALRHLSRRRWAGTAYGAGLAAGLLLAAGGYASYHAWIEWRFWGGWQPATTGWQRPELSSAVVAAGGWLWDVIWRPALALLVALAVGGMLLRARRRPS